MKPFNLKPVANTLTWQHALTAIMQSRFLYLFLSVVLVAGLVIWPVPKVTEAKESPEQVSVDAMVEDAASAETADEDPALAPNLTEVPTTEPITEDGFTQGSQDDSSGEPGAEGSAVLENTQIEPLSQDIEISPLANVVASGYAGEGTNCSWVLYDDGHMTLGAGNLNTYLSEVEWPWWNYNALVKEVTLTGPVVAGQSTLGMFYEMSNLERINNLTLLDTSQVVYMDAMFAGCMALTSIDLSNFNTENVAGMGSVFINCHSLTSLDLSTFNTQNVIRMYDFLAICINLKEVTFPPGFGFSTNQYTMRGFFNNCWSLETLDLSSFNTTNVTDMYYMFVSCVSLKSLNLSSFNTSNVTDMNGMFSDLRNLTQLELGSSFAFINAQDTLLRVPSGNPAPSQAYSGRWVAASNSATYTSTTIPSNVADIYNAEVISLSLVGTPQIGTTLTTNLNTTGGKSFTYQWSKSTTAAGPFTDIAGATGATYTPVAADSYHFLKCSVSADAGATTLVANTGRAYTGVSGSCLWGTDEVGNMLIWPTDEVSGTLSSMNGMEPVPWYTNRASVKTVRVVGSVAAAAGVANMFSDMSNVISIDLGTLNTANATSMSLMFYGCSKLTSITFPSSFGSTTASNDMHAMFYGCSSLTSLDLSSFSTASVTIQTNMFYNCSSLTQLTLSANFAFLNTTDSRPPAPSGTNSDGRAYTGNWVAASNSNVYASSVIPNNVADTYNAEVTGMVPPILNTATLSADGKVTINLTTQATTPDPYTDLTFACLINGGQMVTVEVACVSSTTQTKNVVLDLSATFDSVIPSSLTFTAYAKNSTDTCGPSNTISLGQTPQISVDVPTEMVGRVTGIGDISAATQTLTNNGNMNIKVKSIAMSQASSGYPVSNWVCRYDPTGTNTLMWTGNSKATATTASSPLIAPNSSTSLTWAGNLTTTDGLILTSNPVNYGTIMYTVGFAAS